MSTSNQNDQRLSSVNGGSRRKQIIIVAVVGVVALLVIFVAMLWLRPVKEVTTEVPATATTSGKSPF